jgi:hypothetical protein
MSNEHGFECPECGNDSTFSILCPHAVRIDGSEVTGDSSDAWEEDDGINATPATMRALSADSGGGDSVISRH